MKYDNTESIKSNPIIDDVDITGDTITSRAGLSLFVRYASGIALHPYLEGLFGKMRRSRKGQDISEIFKQLFCFFMNGDGHK